MKIHLGFHFYGAGNIGDDLMVSGFLRFLNATGRSPSLTCCIPHPRDSQSRRFPEIGWLSYEEASRDAALRDADCWLGLGDTPFQTDSGEWFMDHLREESVRIAAMDKPGYMLCVGVNNKSAVTHPAASGILARMRCVWTRDLESADMIARVAGWARLAAAADLAHLFFDAQRVCAYGKGAGEPLMMVISSEESEHLSFAALSEVVMRWEGPVYWYCQEVREFGNTETCNHARLSSAAKAKAVLVRPDYDRDSVEELIGVFSRAGVCLTSRYHSAVAASWFGLRTAVFARNDKLASATMQMGLTPVESLRDTEVMMAALNGAERADPVRLAGLRSAAFSACESFFRILES